MKQLLREINIYLKVLIRVLVEHTPRGHTVRENSVVLFRLNPCSSGTYSQRVNHNPPEFCGECGRLQ